MDVSFLSFEVDTKDLFLSVSLVFVSLTCDSFPLSDVPGLLDWIHLFTLTFNLSACPFAIPIYSSYFCVASFITEILPARISILSIPF